MNYIIDGNNLAGQIGLLKQEKFDKIIKAKIQAFFSVKKTQVFLVFDSSDPMGDACQEKNLRTIYTPKDNYYTSADEKIVEIVAQLLPQEEITVVTKDRELKNQVLKLAQRARSLKKVKLESPLNFYNKINKPLKSSEANLSKPALSKAEEEKINQELLKMFKTS